MKGWFRKLGTVAAPAVWAVLVLIGGAVFRWCLGWAADSSMGLNLGRFGNERKAVARPETVIDRSCNDLVSDLLAQGGEGHTDFKAPMPWPEKGSDERARLIRHMIGFSNARDGGYLLIGVDDATKKAVGLTAQQAQTWDPSHLESALAQYAAPPPRLRVCQGNTSANLLLVAIHIAEFAEQPTLSIKDHVRKSDGPPAERMILRRGALYIRDGASTREIDTEALLRELLGRAYIKSAQTLLQQVKELIDVHWPGPQEPADTALEARVQEALGEIRWP